MSGDRGGFDVNNEYSLFALSNDGQRDPVSLWADPTTHALITDGGGGSSIVQYTDDDPLVAHPIGMAIMTDDGGGVFKFAGQTTPFPVDINAQGYPGIQQTFLGQSASSDNGVTEPYTQRVTISSDSTGVISSKLLDGSGNAITSSGGALNVNATVSGGTGTSAVDNSAFTAGTTAGTPAMGFYHSTIDTVTDGRAATVGITSKRAQFVNLQTAAGVEITNTSNALDINIKSGSIANTSFAVTNAGTFAVQEATLDAALISQEATTLGVKGLTAFGAVTTNAPSYTNAKSDALSLDTSGLLRVSLKDTPANTNKLLVTPDSVALPANQSVNVSQINGITPLMGNGVTGTGSQRVTIASDNTAFSVNAAQATAANLNATVVGTGTFAVQAALSTGTNSIGKISDITTSVVPGTAATNLGKAVANAAGSTDTGVASLAIRTDTLSTLSPAVGAYAPMRVDSIGALWMHVVVDTSATSIAKAEDAASADADVGVAAMAVRKATPANTSGTDGDYEMLQMSAGRLWTWSDSNTATGSAVPANARYVGGNASTALPTAASAGNLTGVTMDKYGRQVVLNNAFRDILGSQTTTIAASTAETTIVTAAANIFNDIVAITLINTSSIAARVDFRDTTGGSIIFALYIPPGDVRGISLPTPWPQTTVNTNWTAQSSASLTDLRIGVLFIKNK